MSYYKNVRIRQIDAPYESSALESTLWQSPASAGDNGLLGGLKNMNWKQLVEQLGGIDGIMNRMNQVQKFVSTMQQFAPMLKMMSGTLGRRAPLATAEEGEEEPWARTTPRRRRKRKNGAPANRRRRR